MEFSLRIKGLTEAVFSSLNSTNNNSTNAVNTISVLRLCPDTDLRVTVQ